MSIDFAALKARLDNLNNSKGKGTATWKPPIDTVTTIRLLPYKHAKGTPFIELLLHYKIKQGSVLISPATYGQPDPVVQFAEKLKSTGNTQDWSAGRQLEPKLRIYVPILVRGQENEGVKFWGFGKEVYTDLLGFMTDPDYGDITDLSTGKDVSIDYSKVGSEFPKTRLRVKPSSTMATTDKHVAEKIMTMPNIKDMFKVPSYEELKQLLDEYLNVQTNESTGASTAPPSTPSSAESSPSKDSFIANVEADFKNLFNNFQ